MKLKVGDKKTDVGIIPKDWDVISLGESTIKVGSGITPTGGEKVYQSYGRPFLRSQNIGWGKLLLDDVAFISDEIHESFCSTEILVKDVLLNITGASIGRSTVADVQIVGGNVNQHVCIIRTKKNLSPDYLNYVLLSPVGQRQINNFQAGGNRQGLNFGQIKTIEIPIPPSIKEQTSIANALSDADALINSLEKLIAKKKNIKLGAVQKLLGPKDGWNIKNLPEICWFQEGPGLRNWQFTKSGMKVINVTNLENGYLNLERTDRFISISEFQMMYTHFEIDENDIVIASSGNSYGKVAVVRKQDLPLVMNTSVIRFKPFKDIDYSFLLMFLKSVYFKNQIDLLITGGAQPNFGPAHLKKIIVNIPQTKTEQINIGNVLFGMEKEIEALERKLEKYKMIKLGMMQNLLTGKIRLIKKEELHTVSDNKKFLN